MKQKIHTQGTIGRTFARLTALGAAIACIAAAGLAAPAKDKDTADAAVGSELLIAVNDLKGHLDIDVETNRENLLQSAFHEVANRNKWLGEYEFKYNPSVSKDRKSYLDFNVIRWERTHTGFYECTISGTYIDHDGESHNLGSHFGTRSGISDTTRFDVADQFRKVAEDAFEDILEAFKKEHVDS